MWPFANVLGFVPLLFLSLRSELKGSLGPMNHKGSLSLSALFIVAWSAVLDGVDASTKEEAERHLQMGKKFLAQGQLADALSHYHAAIESDPDNYVTYYSRATVYLALGKSKSAMPDFDKVLQLKEDFTAARLQRGNVYLKLGKLDEAYIDFERVLSKEPQNAEASEKLNVIEPLKRDLQYAKQLYDGRDYHGAISLLSRGVEICPWDPNIHELRAECYIAVGDYYKAIADIRPTTKLRPDNTAGYFKLSRLNYDIGEAEESLTDIRECLKLDPDHKDCFPHYKKVKKLVKQMTSIHTFIGEERWDECLAKVDQMAKTESENPVYILRADGHRCHCHSKAGHVEEALAICNNVLSQDEGDIEALCDRADVYLLNEQYDDAINDFRKAKDINNEFKRANDGLHRAEKLLKQSKKRDYYKILGVRRNAGKKEIIKAYRKLAVQWHPDKFEGEDKKKAEKKFIDIASAKEVLTDPEKRQKFDNGEDPLDPEEQANNPNFHQGFNPFGAGGFQFKFNFG